MKKFTCVMAVVVAATVCYARPHGGFHHGGGFRPPHGGFYHGGGFRPYHGHHHHGWIAPAIGLGVGAIIGGAIAATQPPVVVQQPVVTTTPQTIVVNQTPWSNPPAVIQNTPTVVQQTPIINSQTFVEPAQRVWVEGRYVKGFDAYGNSIVTWQSGHWEYR